MQYVKNSLVEAAQLSGNEDAIAEATARSVDRKLREMRLAVALEQVATKQEILAGYLNLAFFGHQINGVELIRSEVLNEFGLCGNLIGVDAELVDDDVLYAVFDAFV